MVTHTNMIEFTVEGSGRFPVDMLRYDRATPSTYADFVAVTREWVPTRLREKYRVRLQAESGPTEARWESFGWRVLD
jgi:hypothetical protein